MAHRWKHFLGSFIIVSNDEGSIVPVTPTQPEGTYVNDVTRLLVQYT